MRNITLSYCGEQARKFDKERFLCALFAPEPKRERFFTLLAFHYEIAKIRGTVTDPMVGLIRLQWWREAIEGIYSGNVHNHEVVKPLAELVKSCSLSRHYFDAMLTAREEDLDDVPPTDVDSLIHYCEQTSSSLFCLMLEALGITDSSPYEAAKHLGVAWSLTGMMRAVKFPVAKCLVFPTTLLEANGVSLDDIDAGKNLERTKPIVKALVDIANTHLNKAKDFKPSKQAKPIFLAGIYAETYLKRITKAEYDLFCTDLEGRHVRTQLRLLVKGLC